MPLTCPKCGAENRDKAKFCRKCAQQLVPLGRTDAVPEPKTRRKRHRRPSAADRPRKFSAGWRHMLIAAVAVLLTALAAMLLTARQSATPTRASDHNSTAATATATAMPASTPVPMAFPAPLPAASAIAAASAPAAAPSSAPMAEGSAAHTAYPPATARDSAPTRVTPRAAPRPTPQPRSNASASPPASATPPAAPERPAASMPAPASVPARSVALCADKRFIAHAICLQSECNRPALRQHPQCVRMREQQEALRRGSGDN